MNYNYDIHGLVRIGSDVELPLPDYFRSGDAGNLDITFREEDLDFERPKKCNTMFIGSYCWLDEGGSGLRFEHPMRAKLELDLTRMEIRFDHKFAKLSSKDTLEFLVMRALQMELLGKEQVMVHAGCVAFGDDCNLIVAPSDFGKTSTVLSLVAYGADFLGDDHVIIGEDGTALAYPMELTISPHTITSGVVEPVSHRKRVLAGFGPLYAAVLRLFGDQAEFREVPDEVIKDSAPIRRVFALKGFSPKPWVESVNNMEFAEQMILPVPYATGYPESYADLYNYLTNTRLKDFIDGGMKILENALKEVECYEVRGPSIESWPQAIGKKLG